MLQVLIGSGALRWAGWQRREAESVLHLVDTEYDTGAVVARRVWAFFPGHRRGP
jgi:hypothetical protein